MNIFEQAARQKVRFDTGRGSHSVDVLWDLPLTSKDDLNLDSLARSVNRELKEISEESFVATKPNQKVQLLQLKLELIKFVIADKLETAEKLKTAQARSEERRKLLEILCQKQDQELSGLSREQIEERLKALG